MFKLALFILPFLAVLAFPFYVMWRGGEFVSTEEVIKMQERNDQPYLICAAYNDPWGYIKYRSSQNRGAAILALGSSRVMMIRQTYFQESFYNAARGINEIKDLRLFLGAMPAKARPKILLLGLDPNFLNPGWIWSSSFPLYYEPSPHKEWLIILGKKWMDLYKDLWTGAFDLSALSKGGPELQKIGLIAKAKGNGFLNDGSHYYEDYFLNQRAGIQEPLEKKFEKDLKNVRGRTDVYVPAASISKDDLDELESFLRDARSKDIHVIAYVPPYAPVIYEILRSRKDEYAFLDQLETVLRPLFEKYGFSFFDLKDPAALSATDDEFHDGEHDGGEVTRRLLKTMAEKDPFLEKAISPAMPPSDFIPNPGSNVP